MRTRLLVYWEILPFMRGGGWSPSVQCGVIFSLDLSMVRWTYLLEFDLTQGPHYWNWTKWLTICVRSPLKTESLGIPWREMRLHSKKLLSIRRRPHPWSRYLSFEQKLTTLPAPEKCKINFASCTFLGTLSYRGWFGYTQDLDCSWEHKRKEQTNTDYCDEYHFDISLSESWWQNEDM